MHQACMLGTIAGVMDKMVAKQIIFALLEFKLLMEETHSKQIMAKTFNHMCKSSRGEVEGTVVRGCTG